MHVVAIDRLQGSPDRLALDLASALGITPYEARARVIAPGGGPAVVGAFAAQAAAVACVHRLQAAGFATLTIDSAEAVAPGRSLLAHTLRFGSDGLEACGRNGCFRMLPYSTITALLRGTAFSSATETEVSRERKFSPGRAVLTGGLVVSKTVEKVTQSTSQQFRPFLYVCSSEQPSLALFPEQMDFSTLGPNLQLTREANFAWICVELRRRCPQARWDDRLQTRPGQTQLLGPTLSPDVYLELAIALLAKAKSVPTGADTAY